MTSEIVDGVVKRLEDVLEDWAVVNSYVKEVSHELALSCELQKDLVNVVKQLKRIRVNAEALNPREALLKW